MKKILALMFLSLFIFATGLVIFAEPSYAAQENGVCQAADGNWYYYVNGVVQKGETIQSNDYGWWYIDANGMVDFTYTGIASNQYGTWYCRKGKVHFDYTGFGKDTGGNWWYAVDSKVQTSLTSIKSGTVNGIEGWWYIKNGKVEFINTLATNDYGKWYVEGGRVRFDYTGFVEDSSGTWWYAVDSKVQLGLTSVKQGTVEGTEGWWYVKSGKVVYTDAVASNEYGYWYVENGKVTFSKTGLFNAVVDGVDAWWSFSGSKLQTYFTGFKENQYGWWYVINGKIDFTYTDIISGTVDGKDGWWYVKGNKVTFKDTLVASNQYGKWYVEKSQVTFKYTGFVKDTEGNWWYAKGSKVQTGSTTIILGTVNGIEAWWYIKNGKVEFTDAAASNEYGCWYVENGKVTFSKTGLFNAVVDGVDAWWYFSGSKLQTNFTGFKKNQYGWWYVIDGKIDFTYTDIIYETVDGKSGWWYVNGNKVNFTDTLIASNQYGKWYVEKSQVTFNYTGFAKDSSGKWWYVKGSKVQTGVSGNIYGTVNGVTDYWVVENGKVFEVDYPNLYQGMSSSYSTQMMPYISMLNRFLNQLGYSAEKTNIAYWTSSTKSAVMEFQDDYNLGADGYVGNGTWNTLVRKVMTQPASTDADFEAELTAQGFPESYKVYLRRLHKLHPNWKFVAETPAHSWDTFVGYQYYNNSYQPVSLMTKSWASCLQSTLFSGKTYDGGAWVVPSEETIEYFMDPRNFLDETTIFQFFGDTKYSSIYTESFVSEVASLLGMSYMTGTYTHADGTTINYPKVIVEMCKKYNFNPIMLIASIKQELGTSPEASMISGTYSGYAGYYNYINYGAYQDGSLSPKERGMRSAKEKDWSTREKALEGAIWHYSTNYVSAGQETIYYKKFNAKSTLSYANHQYMSNIAGAYSEGFNMGKALLSKLSNAEITFKIPVYSGMDFKNYLLPDE